MGALHPTREACDGGDGHPDRRTRGPSAPPSGLRTAPRRGRRVRGQDPRAGGEPAPRRQDAQVEAAGEAEQRLRHVPPHAEVVDAADAQPEVAPARADDALLARSLPEQLQRRLRAPLARDPERPLPRARPRELPRPRVPRDARRRDAQLPERVPEPRREPERELRPRAHGALRARPRGPERPAELHAGRRRPARPRVHRLRSRVQAEPPDRQRHPLLRQLRRGREDALRRHALRGHREPRRRERGRRALPGRPQHHRHPLHAHRQRRPADRGALHREQALGVVRVPSSPTRSGSSTRSPISSSRRTTTSARCCARSSSTTSSTRTRRGAGRPRRRSTSPTSSSTRWGRRATGRPCPARSSAWAWTSSTRPR